MNDQELLELAAKAAGILPLPEGKCLDYSRDGGLWIYGGGEGYAWDPLTDDGDALRLSVKLEFDVQQDPDDVLVWYWIGNSDAGCITEPVNNDRFLATRRAIVNAAAEIGRSL